MSDSDLARVRPSFYGNGLVVPALPHPILRLFAFLLASLAAKSTAELT